MSVTKCKVTIRIEVTETGSHDFATPVNPIVYDKVYEFTPGTSANQVDTVWGDAASLAASASELDVTGGLTAAITGSAVSFAEIAVLLVENTTTTTANTLQVGDAGTNPISTLHEAATNRSVIGPGGLMLLINPIDGYACTGGSADTLRIDPGANTVGHKTLLVGRSA